MRVSSSFSALLYDQLREPSNQEPSLARDADITIPPGGFGPPFGPGPVIPPGGFTPSGLGPGPVLPTAGFGPGFGPGPVVPPSSIFASATATA